MEKLSFSPNVRLRVTLAREMELDRKGEVFSADLYQRYLGMLNNASARQDALIRSFLLMDIGLAILLMGKSVKVPILEIGLSDLPAARETLSLLASFAFLFLCMAFHNLQHYIAIVQVFAQKETLDKCIDPDFVSAADSYTEWFVKLFRPKMNLWGPDFFEPGPGYKFYYGLLSFLLTLSVLGMVVVHFALVGWAAYNTLLDGWAFALYLIVLLALNLTGIMASFTPSFEFTPLPSPSGPALPSPTDVEPEA